MGNPVTHWEIGAIDARGLQTFYERIFDWQITPSGPEYSLVAGADGGIGGGILQVSEGVPPYVTFYVQVERLDATLRLAADLGADELVPAATIPGVGRFAMIADPEGRHDPPDGIPCRRGAGPSEQ